MEKSVTGDLVRDLAGVAALPLQAGRETAVVSILQTWLTDANALSAKMSRAAYQTLVPVIVFCHCEAPEGAD